MAVPAGVIFTDDEASYVYPYNSPLVGSGRLTLPPGICPWLSAYIVLVMFSLSRNLLVIVDAESEL